MSRTSSAQLSELLRADKKYNNNNNSKKLELASTFLQMLVFKQKGGRCFTHLCEFKLDHSGIRHVSATTEKTHRNGSCPVAAVLIYTFNLSLPVNKTCFCSPSAGTRCQDETVPRSCGADAGFCRIHR